MTIIKNYPGVKIFYLLILWRYSYIMLNNEPIFSSLTGKPGQYCILCVSYYGAEPGEECAPASCSPGDSCKVYFEGTQACYKIQVTDQTYPYEETPQWISLSNACYNANYGQVESSLCSTFNSQGWT